MVQKIVKDREVLTKPCNTIFDKNRIKQIVQDLKDSAQYYSENGEDGCAGLAANQIGYSDRIIICAIQSLKRKPPIWKIMINPTIVKASTETHISIEGCLSLEGKREVLRHNSVMVLYVNEQGKAVKEHYSGFNAVVIQHEIGHLNGKLI